jgi:REP element-mobilizing transposase RayT
VGKRRNEDPNGGVAHVYARGNDRCLIFRDDADRALYLRLLDDACERAGARCLAYCLMSNHVHLVIATNEGNLWYVMQLVHSRYAQAFNFRHKRVGHLFQGPYGCNVIEDDGHLCTLLRYVDLNPVQARLCDRPEEWEWSSCRALLGKTPPPRFLDVERALASYAWLGGDPRERYAEMVEPPSAATRALDEAPRQRYRRELVRGDASEEAGLDLRDQRRELLALAGGQVPRPTASQPHEFDQPPPLGGVEPPQVILGEQRDLGDGEQLEDGKPP